MYVCKKNTQKTWRMEIGASLHYKSDWVGRGGREEGEIFLWLLTTVSPFFLFGT